MIWSITSEPVAARTAITRRGLAAPRRINHVSIRSSTTRLSARNPLAVTPTAPAKAVNAIAVVRDGPVFVRT
ncbi:hypothetical protein FYJ28_01045 [Arthrobacter sp. BL-252-APC-1A]|uniref:hypothetical protein n=1 Tax=Arthrobacter sp. BL-252-APC-1A TaxID=2606622 RepID=UPI0012B381A7|nr:hypothetical protein [Arthrobacter sp. BL-252-APC-1A]MSR97408.1 hypothetical protein [Arthrobacter sp. BL-252-APC-1A]